MEERTYVFGHNDDPEEGFPTVGSFRSYIHPGIFEECQGRYRYSQIRNADRVVLSFGGNIHGHFVVQRQPATPNDRAQYGGTRCVYIVHEAALYERPVPVASVYPGRIMYAPQITDDQFRAILDNAGTVSTYPAPQGLTSSELLRRAIAPAQAVGVDGTNARERQRREYERNPYVREYVLRRAAGVCEACRGSAPFLRLSDGTPYLEPHHTQRIADGGPDHPRFVGAVCPTCHARIHHGQDGEELNQRLRDHLDQVEAES